MTLRSSLYGIILGLAWSGLSVAPIKAMEPQDSNLCDIAAHHAAQSHGVPVEILLSIARVETGRGNGHTPWPWAVNSAGQGHWFDTSDLAIDFAARQLALGIENFDVGCFQINLQWHSQAFDSLEDAFDPIQNAAYAAQFLAELFQTEGDWKSAVSAYHSHTPSKADAYIERVEAAYSDLISKPALPALIEVPTKTESRPNRFPLLKGGDYVGFGSLVPRHTASTTLIGATP